MEGSNKFIYLQDRGNVVIQGDLQDVNPFPWEEFDQGRSLPQQSWEIYQKPSVVRRNMSSQKYISLIW